MTGPGWITPGSSFGIPLSYKETFEQRNGSLDLTYRFTFIRFSERDIPIEYFAHNSPPPPTLTT